MSNFQKGDYVIATKYHDGNSGDGFCVGFYKEIYNHYSQTRHIVVDSDDKPFLANGFRRVKKISKRRGEWIVKNFKLIEEMGKRFSVWHWVNVSWKELYSYE